MDFGGEFGPPDDGYDSDPFPTGRATRPERAPGVSATPTPGEPVADKPIRVDCRGPPMRRRVSKANARRAIYALTAVALAEIVGTVGFHFIEGAGWINAFYFESMLATGQGPPFALNTNVGKIFASIMGFVSVGSVLSAVIFALGPIMVSFWHEGMQSVESGARRIEQDVVHDVRKLEDELTGDGTTDDRPPRGPGQ
jgi:hypothetical protein